MELPIRWFHQVRLTSLHFPPLPSPSLNDNTDDYPNPN